MLLHNLAVVLALVPTAFCSGRPDVYREPATGMRFVLIRPGHFEMGSPPGEAGRRDDETRHGVTLTHPYYLATTEVTQRQWVALMGSNPSQFRSAGPQAPVERVSWSEVQEFLRRLNAGGEGVFRLPTEAEWEYACRAGTETSYSFGRLLTTSDANYDGRYPLPGQRRGQYRERTVAVASFQPNAWGLYDMYGNVWEWCADAYCPYPTGDVIDPEGACRSPYKVIRGGSWYFGADAARSASRYTHEPQLRGFSIGFRVLRETGGGKTRNQKPEIRPASSF
jgi:sulfatase modifying factor 1